MTRYIEVDTEDFFCDHEGTIGGTARLMVEEYNALNADIGGHDGLHVEATLIDLRIGGLILTAEQIAYAFGAKMVFGFQQRVASDMMEDA